MRRCKLILGRDKIAIDDAHHVITGACSDFADKRDSQCLEQIVELTEENLKENGIELEELLADGGYSSGEALAYLHKKILMLSSQISDNTNPSEKVLLLTKKKTITNAQNPKSTKPNFFSKVKKPMVKVTPNVLTEAVSPIVKTVHSENNVVVKVPSLKSSTIASTKNITTACIKSLPRMKNMPRRCQEHEVKR